MENCEYELVLAHHGTIGMKWGIRRYQNKDGTLTPAGKKRYNKEMEKLKAEEKVLKNRQRTQAKWDKLEEKRKANEDLRYNLDHKPDPKDDNGYQKRPKKRSIKDMSDDEIRSRLERLKLEEEYSNKLISTDAGAKGKKFVTDVLEKSGMNIATQATTYVMGATVNKFAKDFLGVKNATKTTKGDDGSEIIEQIFEDIVNPRKGQKDK